MNTPTYGPIALARLSAARRERERTNRVVTLVMVGVWSFALGVVVATWLR